MQTVGGYKMWWNLTFVLQREKYSILHYIHFKVMTSCHINILHVKHVRVCKILMNRCKSLTHESVELLFLTLEVQIVANISGLILKAELWSIFLFCDKSSQHFFKLIFFAQRHKLDSGSSSFSWLVIWFAVIISASNSCIY